MPWIPFIAISLLILVIFVILANTHFYDKSSNLNQFKSSFEIPFVMLLCRFKKEWKANRNCNICRIGVLFPLLYGFRHTHKKVLIDSSPFKGFEINLYLHILRGDTETRREKNHGPCRQTNTLKILEGQRQPSLVKANWMIHLTASVISISRKCISAEAKDSFSLCLTFILTASLLLWLWSTLLTTQ